MTLESVMVPSTIQSDSETERTCGTCGARKSFNEFYKDGSNKDGSPKYRRDCKDCYRVQRLQNRKVKGGKKK